jgi:hypothetical protein
MDQTSPPSSPVQLRESDPHPKATTNRYLQSATSSASSRPACLITSGSAGQDKSGDIKAKKETAAEYNPELDVFSEELDELGEIGTEFLPITTRAYHR